MHDLILKMLCATRPLLPGRQWVSPRLLAGTGRPQVPRRTSWASQRRWNATTCLAQPGDQDGYSAGGGVGPYGSVVSNGRLHQQGTSLGPEPVEGPALAADSFQWNKQWYPLVPVSYLDRDQPKGMVVLGKSLVVWYHSPSKSWQCFEDMCPHRLAPLSEGRIEPATGSLMCSYHGWEFGPGGACTSIPQADSPQQEEAALGSRRSCVASYPVREQEGMLWVWLDASPSAALESSMRRVALSSELQDGSGILLGDWYMRDLPVSYEYLLENLVDPGHVNFAHHNRIGSRDRAGPIALIQSGPVTAQEGFAVGMDRKDLPGGAPSVTRFVPPSLAWLSFNPLGSGPAFSFLFYAVPIAPGHSRIFAGYSTNAAPAIVRQALKSGALTPLLHSFQWLSDLGAHEIINGDTLFLRHQEGRTAGSGRRWGSAQYFMPSSSDRGVVLLRKWLEECAGGGPAYGPAAAGFQAMAPLTRELVLDRWEQHTKTCPHCSRALTGVRALRSGVSLATTSAFVAAFTLAVLQALSPPPLLRLPPPFGGPLPPRASAPFLLLAGALAGAALNQALAQLEARFVYTDYTHHDK